MAIPAINIWRSAQYSVPNDSSGIRYPLARFCDALNEGQADLNHQLDSEIKSMFADIPANFNSLNFGDIATTIIRVEYIDPERNYSRALKRLSIDVLDEKNRDWKTRSYVNVPEYFIANRQNRCEFFVYPMARRVEEGEEQDSGILETSDGRINITEDSGITEDISSPYLKVTYSVQPKILVPNADNTDIVFEGTTQRAILEISPFIQHALKHYCVAIMLTDDDDKINQSISANHLALYQRAVDLLIEEKQNSHTTVLADIPYNDRSQGDGSDYRNRTNGD